MSERASKKQQELLEFIRIFIAENSYGPSYREIMNGLGYKSVSTVAIHVNNLITKGFLRKSGRTARSVEVVNMNEKAPQNDNIAWLEHRIQQKIDSGEVTETQKATLLSALDMLK